VGLCAALPLPAQDVVQSAPVDPVLAPYLRKQAPPPPLSRPPAPAESPFRTGPFVLSPRLSYRHLSADGLPVAGGRRVASEIRTIAPGLALDMGENWSLDYSPRWVSYTARALSDSVEHAAQLRGGLNWQDWSFDFAQSYDKSNQTLIETARQTDRETWSTQLGAAYAYSPKTQLSFSGSVNERYTSIAPRLRTWAFQSGLNYRISDAMSLTLQPDYSYTEIRDEPDYAKTGLLARFGWRPVDKFSASFGVGVESIESNAAAALKQSNPVLDFSMTYQPFPVTSLSLAVSRSSSSSYFTARTTDNLRWNLSLSQRLLGKLYLSAGYSRQESDYVALQDSVVAGRADEVEAYNVSLSTRLLQRLSVSLVWQKSKNISNLAAFSFSSSQYGIELGYRY
jgi:hypothetical protein